MGIRDRVIEGVRLLASSGDQLKYERDVPGAYVPAELISGYVDDLFHPKSPEFISSFTEDELRDLAELYGLVRAAGRELRTRQPLTVSELQKLPVWRSVLEYAKGVATRLERQ